MIRLTLCLLAMWSSLANATVIGADLILKGGTVYSMDTQGNRHSAIALAGNAILAVGNDSDVALYQTDATTVIDLAGRIVFPGFIDTHIHTMDTLPLLNGVMLSPGQSAEEVLTTRRTLSAIPIETQFWDRVFLHAPLVLMAPRLRNSTLSCLTVLP